MFDDTIAAISTAVSEAGISIIRISGPEAVSAADRIFRTPKGNRILKEVPTHTIHYGYIVDGEETVDEVLVSVMRAPRSFTAEDIVEINCHGGILSTRRVLETVLACGVRAAEPGEFTRRAFLNGRIDLSQAEAVGLLIGAKNEYALRNSVSQLKGSVLEAISRLRGEILHVVAGIEAALDDPEHYSAEEMADRLRENVGGWQRQIRKLIDSAQDGRMITEGVRTVIVGRPNAGKSSLMNYLAGADLSIVTEIAGTTRDVLTQTINLRGVTLLLTDTAGIRRAVDKVEKIGVERARENARGADFILYVVDSSVSLDESDQEIMDLLRTEKKPALILLNKTDLAPVTTEEALREELDRYGLSSLPVLPVSVTGGSGLGQAEDKIIEIVYGGRLSVSEGLTITSVRQKNLLVQAAGSLEKVSTSIEMNMPEDFLTIDLMDACDALGAITGEQAGEDLINEIFSKFCMGK